jgi:4-hydroxybenzoate polyprenyltransferase
MGDGGLSVFDPSEPARPLVDRSIPAGIAILLLILLGLWHFAAEAFLPALALAMLVLALAAFCPEPP